MEDRAKCLVRCVVAMLILCEAAVVTASPELQRSWRDDATLHDVQFVSTRHGWAVGDHGVLWRTADGGQSWTLTETGALATLRSVCLLTEDVGWIAGWQVHGSPELTTAVLLATRDGGQSWESVPTEALSPLKYVRFFGLEEGIVVGEPSPENGTGVWSTGDGGKSWQPLNGRTTRGWHAAALAAPEMGLLADREGNVTLLAGPQLLPSRLPPLTGRSIRDIALSSEHHGWLVGDGGLVMHSETGGVVWEPPSENLPEGIRQVSDFRTVAVKDDAVWITGNPGGIVWHSPDAGRNWIKQHTGLTTPINCLHFVNTTHGCAVGELGTIAATSDGGETWNITRGKQRHLALLSLHHRAATVSPEMLVKIAGEQGFRTAVSVAIRPTDVPGPLNATERLQAAVALSGGNAAEVGWQLPLEIPGMELDAKKLLDHWQRRTEGQLPQIVLSRMVRQLRVWRPQVVILEQPAPEDAAAQLMFDAALHAIEQAGDGTRFIEHRELAGLQPWKVDRIYLQLLPGSSGEIAIEPYEVLPRWQSNTRLAATPARTLLSAEIGTDHHASFRAVDSKGQPKPQSVGIDFFAGLTATPNSDVRRAQTLFDDRHLDQIIKAAQRQRNFISYADNNLDDPRIAAQLIAQLKDVTAEMTPQQSAITLFDLFQEYREQSQWELAEATATELLQRHPQQPVSADAARWLLAYFVSAEVGWHRVHSLHESQRSQPPEIKLGRKKTMRPLTQQVLLSAMPELKDRLPRANQVARLIEERWPGLATSPAVQFPLAALHRGRGSFNNSDHVYRRWIGNPDDADSRDWSAVLHRELWLTQRAAEVPDGITVCLPTPIKPQLDGVLSDDCWQEAKELVLPHRSSPSLPADNLPLVMLTYDDEYFYLAASVPRMSGQSADPVQTAGRTHDADLRRHDRICFRIDTDRDYTTWFEFQVDQRGWTTEACWEDRGYNPHWYVASHGDDTHWRTEVAIPWSELAPKRPAANVTWALALDRTAPTAGEQSWLRPASARQPGPSFGLLRFE